MFIQMYRIQITLASPAVFNDRSRVPIIQVHLAFSGALFFHYQFMHISIAVLYHAVAIISISSLSSSHTFPIYFAKLQTTSLWRLVYTTFFIFLAAEDFP